MDWYLDPQVKDHPGLAEFRQEYEKVLALYLRVSGARITLELGRDYDEDHLSQLRRAEEGLAQTLHHSIKQLFGSGLRAGIACLTSVAIWIPLPEEASDEGPMEDFLKAVSFYIDHVYDDESWDEGLWEA